MSLGSKTGPNRATLHFLSHEKLPLDNAQRDIQLNPTLQYRLDICTSFGTGINDLADFFPCQNQVLSRLIMMIMMIKKCKKIVFEDKKKPVQNELFSC
jgi:hypothetical protein